MQSLQNSHTEEAGWLMFTLRIVIPGHGVWLPNLPTRDIRYRNLGFTVTVLEDYTPLASETINAQQERTTNE